MDNMNSGYKRVKNTLVDVSTVGPLAQKLSLVSSGTFHFSLALAAGTDNKNLGPEDLKQAALAGLAVDVVDGVNSQSFLLDKEVGAGNHSVAAALIQELLLHSVGDLAVVKFYHHGSALAAGGQVFLTSNDTFVTGLPLSLFQVGSNDIIFVSFKALNVTEGSEAVDVKVLETCNCRQEPIPQ